MIETSRTFKSPSWSLLLWTLSKDYLKCFKRHFVQSFNVAFVGLVLFSQIVFSFLLTCLFMFPGSTDRPLSAYRTFLSLCFFWCLLVLLFGRRGGVRWVSVVFGCCFFLFFTGVHKNRGPKETGLFVI